MARTKSSSRVDSGSRSAAAISSISGGKAVGRIPPTASARRRRASQHARKPKKQRVVEEDPPVERNEEESENEGAEVEPEVEASESEHEEEVEAAEDSGKGKMAEVSGSDENESEPSGSESEGDERGAVAEDSARPEGSSRGEGRRKCPYDKAMYPTFRNHVSSMLLADKPKEREALKCKMPSFDAWPLEEEDEEVVKLVKATPLYHLLSSYKTYDPAIISTFCLARG